MKQLPHRQQLGKLGENLAASYLKRQGYRIIGHNFKARYGEIDIIALHKKTLVFIEVKTRIDEVFGTPEEAVTPRKLREVVETAKYYTSCHENLPEAMRIDVIGIQLKGNKTVYFNHIQNVTQ